MEPKNNLLSIQQKLENKKKTREFRIAKPKKPELDPTKTSEAISKLSESVSLLTVDMISAGVLLHNHKEAILELNRIIEEQAKVIETLSSRLLKLAQAGLDRGLTL